MSEDLSKDTWSKQFYKALEAVGNLTEQERLKLGNMLIALSGVKEKHSNVGSTSRCTPIPPPHLSCKMRTILLMCDRNHPASCIK